MFEKDAEEYANKYMNGLVDIEDKDCLQEAYKDGAEFGFQKGIKAKINITTISDAPFKENSNEWHDLREDPKDLPKVARSVWVKREHQTERKDYIKGNQWFGDRYTKDKVIAWTEIPRFEGACK